MKIVSRSQLHRPYQSRLPRIQRRPAEQRDKSVLAMETIKTTENFDAHEFAKEFITSITSDLVSHGLLTKIAKAFEMYPEALLLLAPLLARYLQ